ncbi:unnamed protein product [Ectocarpus sp. 4 AP-2014]
MQIEYSAKMDADEEQRGAEMRKVKDRQVIANSPGVCRDSKQHLRFSAFFEQCNLDRSKVFLRRPCYAHSARGRELP